VVDAVDLRLVEVLVQLEAEAASRRQIAPVGLLDHQPRPTAAVAPVLARQPRAAEAGDGGAEETRWDGQIVGAVVTELVLLVEFFEPGAEGAEGVG